MGAIRKTVNIEYDGQNYECLADFRFIDTVEQRVNIGLFEAQARAGTLQFRDIAWIIYSALKRHLTKLDYYQVGDALLSNMEIYSQAAGDLIGAAFNSEPIEAAEKKKEGQAE